MTAHSEYLIARCASERAGESTSSSGCGTEESREQERVCDLRVAPQKEQ